MKDLNTIDDLLALLAHSYEAPVCLLKMSNTCALSERHLQKTKQLSEEFPGRVARCVVQEAPDVSKDVEMRFGIIHETPQVIVFQDEDAVYYASHENIHFEKVRDLLRTLPQNK